MYSSSTDNLNFLKGDKFHARKSCCISKQRTFKRDAYTATYDLDNKLQTFGNKTITYDNDGNMTSGPITEGGNNAALEFNARGQLMGTGDVAYAYDLENTRTIVMHYDKNKILTQYRYVYNRVGNVPEVLMRVKLTNMTSQSTYYVYGAGLAYEVKITPDGQEAVRYYHYDQVGSTVAMTDSAQAITDRFHYDPWGYVLHSIGDSDTPFQFVGIFGVQTDPNGLINMRARYYNPVTKSFISQDPSGFDGGLNWYLYANGNPFMYTDSTGNWFGYDDMAAAGIGAILGIVGQLIADIAVNGELSSLQEYAGAAVGGAVGGWSGLYTFNPFVMGAVAGGFSNATTQGLNMISGKQESFSWGRLSVDTTIGASTGFIPGARQIVNSTGRGSYSQITKQMITKAKNNTASSIRIQTGLKMGTSVNNNWKFATSAYYGSSVQKFAYATPYRPTCSVPLPSYNFSSLNNDYGYNDYLSNSPFFNLK